MRTQQWCHCGRQTTGTRQDLASYGRSATVSVPYALMQRVQRLLTACARTQWLALLAALWLVPGTVVQGSEEELGELIEQYRSLPPEAKPGECYARVIVPSKYKHKRDTVVRREASEKITVIPAKFEWVEEQVLVQEATEVLKVIPETFRWVEETILVEPPSFRLEPVPATFETIAERVLSTPEEISWQNECGALEQVDNMTGEVACLVTVPATYQTITREVVSEPASTRRVEIPPVYRTVRKQVLDTPARIERTPQPALYETVRVRKMVAPARVERTTTPTEYQSIVRKEKLADERFAWYRSACEGALTEDGVRDLQRALKKEGFDPGDIDGVFGQATIGAIESYQLDNQLARGALTFETLRALDLDH